MKSSEPGEAQRMAKRYHIDLSKRDIEGAEVALLPGDPKRAESIADRLVGTYGGRKKLLAQKREFTTWLARTTLADIVVTSTGIGGPSTSIAVEELAGLGLKRFIRVGTTGAIQPHIAIGDVIITTGAVRLDGASRHYAPIEFPAVAHHRIVCSLIKAAERLGTGYHVGISASSDTFYPGEERTDSYRKYVIRELKGATKEWQALGVLNYEMESATLLTMTASMGLEGGCITGVINRARCGSITQRALRKGERNVIEVAVASLEYLLKGGK